MIISLGKTVFSNLSSGSSMRLRIFENNKEVLTDARHHINFSSYLDGNLVKDKKI